MNGGSHNRHSSRQKTKSAARESKPAEMPEEHAGLINLAEVVEVERLSVPPVKSAPRWTDPSFGAAAKALAAKAPTEEKPPNEVVSPLRIVIQAFFLLFILSWVFVLGIIIGRGHLWESSPGHDLVVWLEEKAGWQTDTPPKIILKEAQRPNIYDSSKRPVTNIFEGLGTDEDSDKNTQTTTNDAPPQPESREQNEAEPLTPNRQDNNWFNLGDASTAANTETADPPLIQQPAPDLPATVLDENEGQYAVQVALVFDEEEAQHRVDRLLQQGFTCYFYKNARNRYPVRVGRFKTLEEAESAKKRLESLGYTRPFISVLGS